MKQAGMVLVDHAQPPRGPHLIYNDPDTLFFAPEAMADFNLPTLPHGVSINAIMMKPGAKPRARVRNMAGDDLFPTAAEHVTTEEMDRRFQRYRQQAIAALT